MNTSSPRHVCDDFYGPLMEKSYLKIFSLSFAAVSAATGIVLVFAMIWFEKFGSDKKRTILNQLIASSCWTYIFHVCLLLHVPEVFRYVYGPLPEFWCFCASVIRNSVVYVIVLYYDAIAIMRYLYIFHLKNPAAFNDDFWCLFITIWINSFSVITQFAWQFRAPRQPLGFYICAGIDPREALKVPLRFYGVVEVLSLAMNLAILFRIKWYKSHSVSPVNQNNATHVLGKMIFLQDLESLSLPDLMTDLYACVSGVLFFVNQMMVNKIDPSLINDHPYAFYVYFIFFINPALMGDLSVAIFYFRHPEMRRFLLNEVLETLLRIRENCFRQ